MMVITIARKPFKGALIDNVQENLCGGIHIDVCRISTSDKLSVGSNNRSNGSLNFGMKDNKAVQGQHKEGRWPANTILSHLGGCVCVGTKRVKASVNHHVSKTSIGDGKTYQGGEQRTGHSFADKDGLETVPDWVCLEGCPVAALDVQSGILKSGAMNSIAEGGQYTTFGKMYPRRVVNPASSGGASRFFKKVRE